MGMAKKVKKKGKKGKGLKGPEPVTTALLIEERTKMLCPRLGDVYTRTATVETILEVCAFKDDFSNIIHAIVNRKCA